jgi:hypothetical protein
MRTTEGSRRLLILFVIAPLLVAGSQSTCGKETLPECPHDWDFTKIQIKDQRTEQLTTLTTLNGPSLSAPQAQTNVPEFNDCQRLVIGTGETARYDSLYAVFAHDSLYDKSNMIHVQLDTGAAVPVVEILSLGGTYPQLALQPGLNCLFVFKENDKWRARMAAFGTTERDCHKAREVSEIVSFPELSIRRTDLKLNWDDYPGVARWEWDVKSNTQVIGFRCLDEWCEVGVDRHTPETGPDLTSTMGDIPDLAGKPVLQVKGWYDEQRLSPAQSHWWKPGAGPRKVVGTIVPVPGLDKLSPDNFDNTWQVVAYVNLSESSTEYYDASSFAPKGVRGVTTISLCMEDWGGSTPLASGGCDGITLKDRQIAKCAPEATAPTIHWWAKTVSADKDSQKSWCIVRRSAPDGTPVPGTGRWRWVGDDETTWARCGGACCSGH